MGKPAAQLLGQRFGRLLIIEQLPNIKGRTSWLCRCDCGTEVESAPGPLRSGRRKSCGCYRAEVLRTSNLRHNMTGTRTHGIWRGILKRCKSHPRYAGRGITICDRWLAFENFLSDMGEAPPGYSIERINNDGNYEPSNCKWIPLSKQSLNTSRNLIVTIGDESLPLSVWCRAKGIRYGLALDRIRKLGWEPVRAIMEKPHV